MDNVAGSLFNVAVSIPYRYDTNDKKGVIIRIINLFQFLIGTIQT